MDHDPTPLMYLKYAAYRFGIAHATLERWCRDGRIPCFCVKNIEKNRCRSGRAYLIDPKVLRTYLDEHDLDYHTRSGITRGIPPTAQEAGVRPWMQEECSEMVNLALDSMDGREKESVIMRAKGYTLEQIGSRIGVTKERTRQILLRAYGKARKRIEKEIGEPV